MPYLYDGWGRMDGVIATMNDLWAAGSGTFWMQDVGFCSIWVISIGIYFGRVLEACMSTVWHVAYVALWALRHMPTHVLAANVDEARGL